MMLTERQGKATVNLVAAVVLLCSDAVLQTGVAPYLWHEVMLPVFVFLGHILVTGNEQVWPFGSA